MNRFKSARVYCHSHSNQSLQELPPKSESEPISIALPVRQQQKHQESTISNRNKYKQHTNINMESTFLQSSPLFVSDPCHLSKLSNDYYFRGHKIHINSDLKTIFNPSSTAGQKRPKTSHDLNNSFTDVNISSSLALETWATPPIHNQHRPITTPKTKLLQSPEMLEELNIKRLSELDNLLFPRIQENRKSRSTNSLNTVEKTTEEINKERMKNKSTLLSHYFEDGKRRVDFVLVHTKPLHPNQTKGEEVEQIQQRSVFEDEGLHLEMTEQVNDSQHVFTKIYASWSVLTRYAEIMRLKMPMRTMQTTWKMLFDDDEVHSMRFTAPYSKDKEYLFDIPPQKEQFFSPAQRAQVIEFILKRKSFSTKQDDVTEFGINKLLSDHVYTAAYPLHEGKVNADYRSPRMQLIQNWASVKMAFHHQPLDEIKNYFGVKIALYFAWLGFYTSMLIPASVVGVLCFLFGFFTLDKDIPSKEICNNVYDNYLMCPQCAHDCNFTRVSDSCIYAKATYLFDNPATVFFAIFMSLWATVYLEMWKRYSARITYRWDLSNFDAVEEYPRPEYLARLSNVSNRRLNVITRMYEPYIPFWRRQLPYTVLSASIVFFLILVAMGSVVSVIVYRSTIRSFIRFKKTDSPGKSRKIDIGFLQKYSSIVVSSSAAGLNLIFILMLNNLYSRIANYLTELEMPRTQTEFDNSLTLKMFLLQFVNYYSSIFYIAFFKGRFIGNPGEFDDESLTQEECASGGCLLELAIQLSIIMIGRQMFSAAIELCMPFAYNMFNRWKYRTGGNRNRVTRFNVPQWEEDFLLTRWLPTSLFYEYLEMVIQFGFVTIFVSAFPLAPLFALINNVFEIRLDARKMITVYRRPVAQRVKNIGIWYRILDTICKLSVITNAMIIAFTTEFVPRLIYYFEHGALTGYVNSTLSFFEAKVVNEHLKLGYDESKLTYCLYPDYREPPWAEGNSRYKFTSFYYKLLAFRLLFVVIFENIIAAVTSMMRWLIPDIPQQLRQQMRQHAYLTNELILQQEYQRAKEISNGLDKSNRARTAALTRTSRMTTNSCSVTTINQEQQPQPNNNFLIDLNNRNIETPNVNQFHQTPPPSTSSPLSLSSSNISPSMAKLPMNNKQISIIDENDDDELDDHSMNGDDIDNHVEQSVRIRRRRQNQNDDNNDDYNDVVSLPNLDENNLNDSINYLLNFSASSSPTTTDSREQLIAGNRLSLD
ncbi:anoctamin-1-like protein [Euroglyphus maynei]|uniref:Anoctamin n=1 Tax=Euroglyphus maynei TaxID=6958 RepID=A0A1Y3B3X1_EURMA|nr:anoctamin-1-like protein [Euroglyphus maynei]